jgi:hypothetical protein
MSAPQFTARTALVSASKLRAFAPLPNHFSKINQLRFCASAARQAMLTIADIQSN